VTAYLVGDLSAGERKRFEAHLAACDGCTTYVEQLRRTIELTGTLRVDDVSPEAEEALRSAFRDWKGR
jgi:anti-sigma factor RsiW